MKWNPFQPSVEFHIETSHLFCRAKQMTGFYMKHKNGLKWAKNKTLLVRTGRNSFRWPKSLCSQENIFSDHKIVLTLPGPYISESCVIIKPFEAPQRSVKIKFELISLFVRDSDGKGQRPAQRQQSRHKSKFQERSDVVIIFFHFPIEIFFFFGYEWKLSAVSF